MPDSKPKVLIADDEEVIANTLAMILTQAGFETRAVYSGEQVLEVLPNFNPDLLISDVIMPGIDGPTLLKKARGFIGSAPVMFISGYAEAEFSDVLEGETGVTFLPKPLDIKILAERVKQQLQAA